MARIERDSEYWELSCRKARNRGRFSWWRCSSVLLALELALELAAFDEGINELNDLALLRRV